MSRRPRCPDERLAHRRAAGPEYTTKACYCPRSGARRERPGGGPSLLATMIYVAGWSGDSNGHPPVEPAPPQARRFFAIARAGCRGFPPSGTPLPPRGPRSHASQSIASSAASPCEMRLSEAMAGKPSGVFAQIIRTEYRMLGPVRNTGGHGSVRAILDPTSPELTARNRAQKFIVTAPEQAP